jgi:uncharacterized protein YjiS (DUF1127 family)
MRKLPAYISPLRLLQPLAASPAADAPPRVHPEVEAWAIRAAASNGFGGELVSTRSGGASIDAKAGAAFVDLSDPLASAVVRARRYARRAAALYRLHRRRARHRAELRQLQSLDAAALRDLGLTRSEIGSVLAEAAGRAEATRRAVVEHEWFRLRAGVPVGASASF